MRAATRTPGSWRRRPRAAGGPRARRADAGAAGRQGAGQLGLERGQLARLLGDADAAGVVEDGDAGAVVAAVTHPGEAIEEDGCRLAAADVAHDAAHGVLLP